MMRLSHGVVWRHHRSIISRDVVLKRRGAQEMWYSRDMVESQSHALVSVVSAGKRKWADQNLAHRRVQIARVRSVHTCLLSQPEFQDHLFH